VSWKALKQEKGYLVGVLDSEDRCWWWLGLTTPRKYSLSQD